MQAAWAIGGGLFLFAMYMAGVSTPWLVAFAVAGLGWTFNSLVSARNAAETAFSTIDVMLKMRFDLIPSLVDAAARYMEHESDVLEEVMRLRSRGMAGDADPERAAEVDRELAPALSRLLATAEAYPELKANESFQQLQGALNEVEDRIAAARRTYNMAAKRYNDGVRMFPTNLIARAVGYRERPYFEIPQGHAEAPDVRARFRENER